MSFWTFANLADVTKGTWLVAPDDPSAEAAGLWHDTRELQPGKAYLAIKGENFDGHDFIDKAFEAGAALAIVSQGSTEHEASASDPTPLQPGSLADASCSDKTAHTPRPTLFVNDTIVALQDLARAYRDVLKEGGCKVIGIAGSNGKTTTRHLIHHVLTRAGLTGTQSPKSFNNHLGVPLTLLQAKPSDDFVACEIGTNHPGEIDFLSAIVRPDIAVITSIGEEHLEFFHNVRNVAKEEVCIFDYLVADGIGLAAAHDLDRYLRKLIRREDINVVAGWYEPTDETTYKRLASMGDHVFSNASLAGSIAEAFDVDSRLIDEAIVTFKTPTGRGEALNLSDLTVINDAYNANPSSTRAALDMLESTNSRKVFVLGDMLELGERSEDAHSGVGIHAHTCKVSTLITIGGQAKFAADGFESCHFNPMTGQIDEPAAGNIYRFPRWTDDLPDQIADLLQPGDTVLLKASRGMRLERLIPAIERRFGPATDEKPT